LALIQISYTYTTELSYKILK